MSHMFKSFLESLLRLLGFKKFGGAIVDFGNVVIDHSKTTPEMVRMAIDHPEIYNAIPEVRGAMDGLKELSALFGGNVTLVYKATDTVDSLILGWMAYHRLYRRTGIPLTRVVRIMDTGDKRDKTGHLDQHSDTHYGTSVVIDDRAQVVIQFVPKMLVKKPQDAKHRIEHVFLFCPRPSELEEFDCEELQYVREVWNWSDIITTLKSPWGK